MQTSIKIDKETKEKLDYIQKWYDEHHGKYVGKDTTKSSAIRIAIVNYAKYLESITKEGG